MRITEIRKKIYSFAIILISCWIIGFLMLILVYMLPVERMHENAKASLPVFEEEGVSPQIIRGYISTRLDNYTDMLMINTAIYNGGESILSKAMGGLRYDYSGNTAFESGVKYLQGEENPETLAYARYWHGWIVFLKPLLLVFQYSDIRFLNFILQTVIAVVLIVKMGRNGMMKYLPFFVCSLIVIMPVSTAMGMGYSLMYYTILGSSTILLFQYEQLWKKNRMMEYFVLVGAITCYLDLVTYPLAALGIPMTFWLLLEKNRMKKSVFEHLKDSTGVIISWLTGYAGMWVGKWLIGSVTTEENVLKDAILMVLYRASYESGERGTVEIIQVGDVLRNNLGVLNHLVYLVVALAAILMAVFYWYKKEKTSLFDKGCGVILGLIGCMPFVWLVVIGNHSYIHYWMVYRILSITVFSWGCLLVDIMGNIKCKIT